jgi:hypothetical protein
MKGRAAISLNRRKEAQKAQNSSRSGSSPGRRVGLICQGSAAYQPGMSALQITPEDIHAAGLDADTAFFEIAEHAVMDDLLAQFNDLNVEVIEFPELAFGQSGAMISRLPLIHTPD